MKKNLIKIITGTILAFAVLINNNTIIFASENISENTEDVNISTYIAGDTKVSIMGDSISTYTGYITYNESYNDDNFGNKYNSSIMSVEDTWWMGLLMDNNWTLDANESLGGSCVTKTDESSRHMSSDVRIERLSRNGDPDKIFVYGGTNDILSRDNPVPMGDINNLTYGRVDNFADAYYTMIKNMQKRYPNAQIICMVPFNSDWANVFPSIDYAKNKVCEYIKSICNRENILCVDLRNAGINSDTDLMDDSIHPNSSGMKKIKNFVEKGLNPVKHYSTNDGNWNGTTLTLYDGTLAKDAFFCDGTYTYYLQHDGTPMKNRLTYHPDGVHIIYFDENGHEVFNNFTNVKQSIVGDAVDDFCFFDVYGYMYNDTITYDQSGEYLYYVNPCGVIEHNGWFQFSDKYGGGMGYANSNGSLIVNQFYYDQLGRIVYFQADGTLARGVISDGVTNYEMDETDGHLVRMF